MPNDTRDKNEYFDHSNIVEYFDGYADKLREAIGLVDLGELESAQVALMDALKNSTRIFVGGNGGSAAISEHLSCDVQKGCHTGIYNPRVHSMTSNTALLTAVANDLSYTKIFSYQFEAYCLEQNELVILISSSGNSPNIVSATKWAQAVGAKVIGLTGFDGGFLREHADISLHIPIHNYGIVEDCHQSLIHMLAQFTYLKLRS